MQSLTNYYHVLVLEIKRIESVNYLRNRLILVMVAEFFNANEFVDSHLTDVASRKMLLILVSIHSLEKVQIIRYRLVVGFSTIPKVFVLSRQIHIMPPSSQQHLQNIICDSCVKILVLKCLWSQNSPQALLTWPITFDSYDVRFNECDLNPNAEEFACIHFLSRKSPLIHWELCPAPFGYKIGW
jgi:hypothetical protein